MEYKYLVFGNHPIFQRVDRRCCSWKEAENVKKGLNAIGYEVNIASLYEETRSKGVKRKRRRGMLSIEEAGVIAVNMSEHLDAKEQAFFVAGFQEAIKYLDQNKEA